MKRFPVAAFDSTRDKEPPKTWSEFEEFCTDVFPLVQSAYGIARIGYVKSWLSAGYGKVGNAQWGVDLFDYFSTATVQCKLVEKFTKGDLLNELKELRKYPYRISAHFFMTSLDETDRKVLDEIRFHNEKLTVVGANDWPMPELPGSRLPKLYVLNWPDLKRLLVKDFFLASKWGFRPFEGRYIHLHGLDINSLERAVRSRSCFLPPNIGGKTPHVAEAILRITDMLDVVEISKIGSADFVLTKTLEGMFAFIENIEGAIRAAGQFDSALGNSSSLDSYSRHQALDKLNSIAMYYQRIDALKYLHRLYDSVKVLAGQLDSESYYYHPEEEVEFEDGRTEYLENPSVRFYRFHGGPQADYESYYPSLSKIRIASEAQFIAAELYKVRT